MEPRFISMKNTTEPTMAIRRMLLSINRKIHIDEL